jgi:hypothetical protein
MATGMAATARAVLNPPLVRNFYAKIYRFTKTGSGHIGKTQKEAFFSGDPGVGGPFPDMCIGGLAIDRAHKGNGCLQMMRGSHKLGTCGKSTPIWSHSSQFYVSKRPIY